ncbi:hypothetical protein IP81_01665 [Novosphingobium sp. AAP83]|uniref:hypothetical protein n=1 Tax=Novosphingobium sp. AAP83 TaxID=1523425 RepID=UPI0006B99C84|nr:hypothetical protein [Novosphingobium sp. AAP83]KPF93869.1 hypothetical protein IP81_01665 [Novosphingobium sp. AAP83]
MATIMSLFSRRNSAGDEAAADELYLAPVKLADQRSGTAIHSRDIGAFEMLGENQQSIDFAMTGIYQGLVGLQSLAEQMAALKTDLNKSFEDHRKLALSYSSIRQDRDHAQTRLAEKTELYEAAHGELVGLRTEIEDVRRNYERARTDFEALEHRHHLLSVAKRETEDQLTRNGASLGLAQDEIESLRLEAASLQDAVDTYGVRVAELTSKYNDANNRAVLLSNRCEGLESALQQKADELIGLAERFDLVFQEKESAVLYSQQKEQEAIHARAEMTRIFQQTQQEKKGRELTINQLRAEIDGAQAQVKTLEEVHGETLENNERLISQVRKLDDQNKQSDITIGRLETKVVRLTAKLDSTVAAKSQLDQSRATMTARLEAVTQTLYEREADVKRLEGELQHLTAQTEKQNALSHETIESLSARVFELEKELSAQRNETAFYTSQLEVVQRSDSRTAKN